MRPASILLVCSFLLLTALMTSIDLFGDLRPRNDIRLEEIRRGDLVRMFTGPTFWSRYPTCPAFGGMMDPSSILTAFALAAPVLFVFKRCLGWPLHRAGFTIMALAAVPYSIGWLVLSTSGGLPLERVGAWIAFMLVGPFYMALTAFLLAVYESATAGRAHHVETQPVAARPSAAP